MLAHILDKKHSKINDKLNSKKKNGKFVYSKGNMLTKHLEPRDRYELEQDFKKVSGSFTEFKDSLFKFIKTGT